MVRIAKSPNVSLSVVLAAVLVGVTGCGADPATDASRNAAQPQAAAEPAAPVIRGTKPTLAASVTAAEQSSPTIKCNIETIAEQSLEGVRPAIDTKKVVGIVGWYAALDASASPATPPAGDTGTDAPAQPAAAAEGALQLVISDESGARHWVVPVSERTERPDVADGLKNPTALKSGFAVDLDLSEFTPGFYNMHLSDAAHSVGSICGVGRGFAIE